MGHAEGTKVPQDHGVTFFDHDGEAIGAIARYVTDGLSAGDRVIVIATERHIAELDDRLQVSRINPGQERSKGSYLTVDAAQMLRHLMVDGSPERALFAEHVGGIVGAAGRDGSAVRIFGEMVALLWEGGSVAAALELEAMWNELAETYDFGLLCGYPTQALGSATLAELSSVCGLHSDVEPPLRYTAGTDANLTPDEGRTSEVFLPVRESARAARNFVAGRLGRWGDGHLYWDATLIISELATNAVAEGSAFRVAIDRAGDVVRIAVEDVAPGHPQRRTTTPDDPHGRGVPIVESLARRWGCDRAGEGKVVWAELNAPVR